MKLLTPIAGTFLLMLLSHTTQAQPGDSLKHKTIIAGNIGVTTNGFSIIPTFSLNKPAAVMNFYFGKRRLSFEPDIRLAFDATKGGMIWWLRYRIINQQKFKLRLGVHPAFTFVRKDAIIDGVNTRITEMLRFGAFEVVPSYQFNPHFGVSTMYLEGHGLQSHGPQTTRVLFLNANLTNLRISKNFRAYAFPSIFFLNTDGDTGSYFTATAGISHVKYPFALQSTINQTFKSNIPGNQQFMWNITLNYSFRAEAY